MKTVKNNILSSKRKLSIVLIDNQPLFRTGLALVLSKSGYYEVSLELDDYIFDFEQISWINPDIIIMDIMPGKQSPFDFIRWCREKFPDVPILVLTMMDEQTYAERTLKAGAAGYIMKNRDGNEILTAVKKIARNELYVSDNISSLILIKYVGGIGDIKLNPDSILTDRELEVFTLMGQGLTSREISLMLNISVKTADNHKTSIREKLGLKNHIELSQKAALWYEKIKGD